MFPPSSNSACSRTTLISDILSLEYSSIRNRASASRTDMGSPSFQVVHAREASKRLFSRRLRIVSTDPAVRASAFH